MHGLSYRNIAFIKFLLCGSKAIYYLKANPIKRKQQLPDCTDCNKHQVYQQLPNILLKKKRALDLIQHLAVTQFVKNVNRLP